MRYVPTPLTGGVARLEGGRVFPGVGAGVFPGVGAGWGAVVVGVRIRVVHRGPLLRRHVVAQLCIADTCNTADITDTCKLVIWCFTPSDTRGRVDITDTCKLVIWCFTPSDTRGRVDITDTCKLVIWCFTPSDTRGRVDITDTCKLVIWCFMPSGTCSRVDIKPHAFTMHTQSNHACGEQLISHA